MSNKESESLTADHITENVVTKQNNYEVSNSHSQITFDERAVIQPQIIRNQALAAQSLNTQSQETFKATLNQVVHEGGVTPTNVGPLMTSNSSKLSSYQNRQAPDLAARQKSAFELPNGQPGLKLDQNSNQLNKENLVNGSKSDLDVKQTVNRPPLEKTRSSIELVHQAKAEIQQSQPKQPQAKSSRTQQQPGPITEQVQHGVKDNAEAGGPDGLIHRLPQNYFINDDDEEDMDQVMSNIQNMRNQMLSYVQEANMDDKLMNEINDIADIIEPRKFIQKHYQDQMQTEEEEAGAEAQPAAEEPQPPRFLFEEVLKEAPCPKIEKEHTRQKEQEQFEQQKLDLASQNQTAERQVIEEHVETGAKAGGQVDFWGEDVNAYVNQEPHELQMDLAGVGQEEKDMFHQLTHDERTDDESEQAQKVEQIHTRQTIEDGSAIENVSKGAQPTGKSPSGPRLMKMADYFAMSADESSNQRVGSGMYDQGLPGNEMQRRNIPPGADFQNQVTVNSQIQQAYLSGLHLEKCEKELLQNVSINFLFAKGGSLSQNLLDANRIYQIVEKIKELARQQVANGSKDINFDELVAFLANKELGFVGNEPDTLGEPKQILLEKDKDTRWQNIVNFMRNNPKLLMQMIPDSLDDPPFPETNLNQMGATSSTQQAEMVLKRSRVYDKIQEAQQWQKLQKLSQNFMEKRSRGTGSRPASGVIAGGPREAKLNSISSMRSSVKGYPPKNPASKTTRNRKSQERTAGLRAAARCNPSAIEKTQPLPQPDGAMNRRKSSQSGPLKEEPELNIDRKMSETKNSNWLTKDPMVKVKEKRKFQGLKPILTQKGRPESLQLHARNTSTPKGNTSAQEATFSNKKEDMIQKVETDLRAKKQSSKRLQSAHNSNLSRPVRQGLMQNTHESHNSKKESINLELKSFQPESERASQILVEEKKSQPSEKKMRGQSAHPANRDHQGSNQRSHRDRISAEQESVKKQNTFMNAPPILGSERNSERLGSKQDYGKRSSKFIDPTDAKWKMRNQMDYAVNQESIHQEQGDDQQGLNKNPRFRSGQRPITAKAGPNDPNRWDSGSRISAIPGGRKAFTKYGGSRDGSNGPQSNLNVHAQMSEDSLMVQHKQQNTTQALSSNAGLRSNFMGSKNTSKVEEPQFFNKQPPKFVNIKNFGPKRLASLSKNSEDGASNSQLGQLSRRPQTFYKPANYNPLRDIQNSQKQNSQSGNQDSKNDTMKSDQRKNGTQLPDIRQSSNQPSKPNFQMSNRSSRPDSNMYVIGNENYQNENENMFQLGQHPINVQIDHQINQQSGRMKSKSKSKSPKRAISQKSPKTLKSKSPKSDKKGKKMKKNISPKSSKAKSPKQSDIRVDKSKNTNTAASPFPPYRKESDIMGLQELVGSDLQASKSTTPKRILSPKRNKSHTQSSAIPRPEHHVGTSTTELQKQLLDKASIKGQRSEHSPDKLSRKGQSKPANGAGEVDSVQAKCETSVQTNIRGIEHKILIRPDRFDSDPFGKDKDDESDMGRLDKKGSIDIESQSMNGSMLNSEKAGGYKVPTINWTETPLHQHFKENPIAPNVLPADNSRYTQDEVDQVLQMVKNSYSEFQRTDLIKPFYLKALQTLSYLLAEQTIEPIFERVKQVYKEITLENSMKLLIRCKLAFESRSLIIEMFQHIGEYRKCAQSIKSQMDKQTGYYVEQQVCEELLESFNVTMAAASRVIKQAAILSKSSHRQLRGKTFVFENKDAVAFVKRELGEIRKLVETFKVPESTAEANSDSN